MATSKQLRSKQLPSNTRKTTEELVADQLVHSSALQQAYDELARSEARYKELYENAPDMYHTLDLEGNFVELNPKHMELLGYSLKDLDGHHFSEIVPEQALPRLQEGFQKLLVQGDLTGYELDLKKSDGSVMTVEVHAMTFDGPTGQAGEVRCIMRDITERKMLEGLLGESLKMESVVDEIARIITSTLDIDLVYEPFVAEVKKLVDFDRIGINVIDQANATVCARYVAGLEVTSSPVGVVRPLEGTLSEQLVKTRETVIRPDLSLSTRYGGVDQHSANVGLRSGIALPLVSSGRVVATLSLLSQSIDRYGTREQTILERLASQIAPAIENAQLYAERVRTEEALTESEARSRAVMETAPDGIITLDSSGLIESFNPAAEGIFGYTAWEVLGRDVNILMAEPYRGKPDRYLSRYAAAPEADHTGVSREVEGRRKDGVIFPMDLSVGVVETGTGKGFTYIIRDITERKLAEARINESSRLISIGELAAGVAHEINNPLTSVQGFAEIALKQELPDKVREYIQTIFDEAQRASTIVRNLLFFARRSDTEKRFLDLNAIAHRALEMKSYDFSVNNIEIVSRLSPEISKTMADEHQLVQVFLNILTNAEQAMQKAHGKGKIEVHSAVSGGEIEITMKDDGPGISPEDLHRIFEPFFTTKEVGQGTGLGLSISYGIIKQHGGNIWADSDAGTGTTFHITLPVVMPDGEPVFQMPDSASIERSTSHLLIVDDEPHIRDLLMTYLELERYTVDLAEDGQEAWRKLQNMEYDCVILDLKMPGMSGQNLYELIRENIPGLTDKVVFITGDTVSPDTRDFVSKTGNPLITKPFQLNELLQKVQEVWD